MQRTLTRTAWPALVLLCLVGFIAGMGASRPTLSPTLQKAGKGFRDAFALTVRDASQATVRFVDRQGRTISHGTVLDAEGWIVTRAAEWKTGQTVACMLPGAEKAVTGRVAGIDRAHDVALVKLPVKGLTPVRWAQPGTAAVGQWVATASPEGEAIAVGIISVPRRGIPRRSPILGVSVEQDKAGVRVLEVFPNTGAARAKLEASDIILAVAGHPTPTREAQNEALALLEAGQSVAVQLQRQGNPAELKVTLSHRPEASTGDAQATEFTGEISRRRDGYSSVLQHDSVIAPWQCGGPLVDLTGGALGINICRAGRTETYALPADVVLQVVQRLRTLD